MQHIKHEDFEYLINLIIQYLGQLGVPNPVLNNAAINHIVNALSFGLKPCDESESKANNVDNQYEEAELKKTHDFDYGFDNKKFFIIPPVIIGKKGLGEKNKDNNKNCDYVLKDLSDYAFPKSMGISSKYNLKTDGNCKFCKFVLKNSSENTFKRRYSSKDKFVPICKLIAEFYANLLKKQFSIPENIYFQIATLDILFDILFENYKKVISFDYSLENILDCVFEPVRPQYGDTEIDKIIIIEAFLNTCENLNSENGGTLQNYIDKKNNVNLE